MKAEDHYGEISPPRRLWHTPTWLISHVAGDAHRAMVEFVEATGRTDYAVLAGLEEFGALSQAALGRRLGLDRSDVSVALDRLESEGSLTREPDPAHARRKLVSMTPAGRRHLDHLESRISRAQQQLLAPLSPTEAATLVSLLQQLVQHHRGYCVTSMSESGTGS